MTSTLIMCIQVICHSFNYMFGGNGFYPLGFYPTRVFTLVSNRVPTH